MAERHNVLIANQFIAGSGSDSAARPSLVLGDGDSGIYEDADDNVSISSAGSQRLKISGSDVLFIANGRSTTPGNPVAGGYLFVSGGSLQFVGSSGTLTRLAAP